MTRVTSHCEKSHARILAPQLGRRRTISHKTPALKLVGNTLKVAPGGSFIDYQGIHRRDEIAVRNATHWAQATAQCNEASQAARSPLHVSEPSCQEASRESQGINQENAMLQLEGTVAALMLSWPWLEYVARKLNMSLVYSPIRSARTCAGARVCGASPSETEFQTLKLNFPSSARRVR